MSPRSPAMVWQSAGGDEEGMFVEPIHNSVVKAASQDNELYQVLGLVEAIRLGKPRELKIARDLLGRLLKG
jgi:hypothetical protein